MFHVKYLLLLYLSSDFGLLFCLIGGFFWAIKSYDKLTKCVIKFICDP